MNGLSRLLLLGPLTAVCLLPAAVLAQNDAFQSFFFSVCDNPSGSLATRCAETPDGGGDLSGNSESSLNPSQTVSSNQTPLANARGQIGRAQERVDRLNGGPTGQEPAQLAIGPFSLMLNGSYTWFEQDASASERGFEGDVRGLELGFDRRFSDSTVAGLFLGWESSDFEFDRDEAGVNFTPQGDSGTNESDTLSLVLFGAVDFSDQWYLEGSVGASRSEYEFQRNVVFQESRRTIDQTDVRVRGEPDGEAYWGSLSLGYRWASGPWTATPYLGANVITSDIDDYQEEDLSGSGLNMRVSDSSRDSTTAVFGVSVSRAVSTRWGVLLPHLNVEYQHEFDEDAQTGTTAFALDAAGNSYTLNGDGPDRDYFLAGAGVMAILPNGWITFLNYEGLLAYEDRSRHQVVLGIRREF